MVEHFKPHAYDRFTYRDYTLKPDGTFRAYYRLSGSVDAIDFTETIKIPVTRDATQESSRTIARLLALACGLSYYKAAAPAVIDVQFGLTPAERVFLKELITNGLGEFAFQNQLLRALTPEIVADARHPVGGTKLTSDDSVPLVPVGGGKDSIVTIKSLKRTGFQPKLFSVNTFTPITRTAQVSGLELLSAKRSLDPTLITLNDHGAYNGHVPVTAINSLIALLTAHVGELGPVVMSNERSAEYGNLEWSGRTINHQWSKSIEFEKLLLATLNESDAQSSDESFAAYFSLLRPLSEIDIARRFAKLPEYWGAFTSCNRAFHLDEDKRATAWCRRCPKCQFVFLILAPFVPREELERTFGGIVLDDARNFSGYRNILGLEGHKPFECVGEYSEAALALLMLADDDKWKHSAAVVELSEDLQQKGLAPTSAERHDLLHTASEHCIPPRFREALDALA